MTARMQIGTLAAMVAMLGVGAPGVDMPRFSEPPEPPPEPTDADRRRIEAAQAKQARKAARRLVLANRRAARKAGQR